MVVGDRGHGSVGNSGPDGQTVSKPGDDPYVITDRADDDEGTINVNDDQVPVFRPAARPGRTA